MDDLVKTVSDIELLLRKYGRSGKAEFVSEAVSLLRSDRQAGLRHLQHSRWWGGAGTIADTALYQGEQPVPEGLLEDDEGFARLLVRLYERATAEGIALDRARPVVQAIREYYRL